MTSNPLERQNDRERHHQRVRDANSVSLDPLSDEIHYTLRLERLASRTPHARRYKLEGEIARGGMGAILKIWDEDIRRHLAMKVILRADEASQGAFDTVSADLMRRFLDEAQISGQLDHPGVVPVYELGTDEDGRAYFTMPVVEGRQLGEIIDLVHRGKEGWTRTRALEVFVKVCDTLAYAHAKLVIHRDLKPANVMVGRYGQVYVMDWGLAKVLGRPELPDEVHPSEGSLPAVRTDRSDTSSIGDFSQLTLDGTIMGTPAYMPPEQARGRVDDLGPCSDVFSIGAMLYHLLAGHPPFLRPGVKMDLLQLLARVRDKSPAALPSIDRSIPAELVAICEKAMARDPAKRYASSAEMGEDLRAFLESRVVKAHRSGAVAELRKWVERNRGMAVASAVALVAVLAGAIASLAFGSNAVFQRNRATSATGEAKQRQAQAEDLISFMVGDLREKLEPLGQLEILDDVGAKALAYFETIDESNLTEPELTRQALALTQIGEVRLSQRRYTEAVHSFESAFRRSRELALRSPDNGDRLYDRGQAEFWIGYVHWQRLELDRAIEWMTLYLETSKGLLDIDPDRTEWIREVAYGYHNLAVLALDFGRLELAAEGFRKEVELLENLITREPSSGLREDLADAFSYRGTTARRLGELRESADHLATSVGLRAALREVEPEDRRKRFWWALAILLEAEVLIVRGQTGEAFQAMESSERILESLALEDPTNTEWALHRAVARMEFACIGAHLSKTIDALQRVRRSASELEVLVSAEPKSRNARRGLARAHVLGARLTADAGELTSALNANALALELCRVLLAENQRDVVSAAGLADALVLEAELRALAADPEAARRNWLEALVLIEPLVATSKFDRLLDSQARALHGLNRHEEAAAIIAGLDAQGYRPLRPWP